MIEDRLAFDVLAAALLALTALAGAYAPVWLSGGMGARGGRSVAYSIGNMFSAGVMVSAGFCHLLADAERRLHSEDRFPLAPFLCALGFLLTLFADEVATNLSHNKAPAAHSHASDPGDCCGSRLVMLSEMNGHAGTDASPLPVSIPVKTGAGAKVDVRLQVGGSAATTPRAGASHAPADSAEEINGGPVERVAGLGDVQRRGMHAKGGGYDSLPVQEHDDLDIVVHGEEQPLVSGISNLLHLDPEAAALQPGAHGAVSFFTAVLMGIALCFHSLLEGAAMGAERTVADSLHIFIAIIAHKGLAAYALGSSLVDSKTSPKRFWAVILFFVFATPVGIFLGYLVSEVASGDGTASISALAAGTFLYVAAMEVIPKELHSQERWFGKLVALMMGFGAMSLLAIWA